MWTKETARPFAYPSERGLFCFFFNASLRGPSRVKGLMISEKWRYCLLKANERSCNGSACEAKGISFFQLRREGAVAHSTTDLEALRRRRPLSNTVIRRHCRHSLPSANERRQNGPAPPRVSDNRFRPARRLRIVPSRRLTHSPRWKSVCLILFCFPPFFYFFPVASSAPSVSPRVEKKNKKQKKNKQNVSLAHRVDLHTETGLIAITIDITRSKRSSSSSSSSFVWIVTIGVRRRTQR